MRVNESFFDNKVIKKPWGSEYVVYRFKNLLSVTFLEIKPGKKTSLHCHTNKKTGFIVKNDKQLGEKMLDFFNNKDLLNTYSKNAYDLMKNYWNYDLYINCLNKFIGKIRDENRSGN